MRLRRSQLAALERAVAAVLPLAEPADKALSKYFRASPALGQRDRAWIADTVFALLRRLRSLRAVAGTGDARGLALAALVRLQAMPVEALIDAASAREREWLTRVATAPQPEDPAACADLPDWLWARLSRAYPADVRDDIAASLLEPAPLDIRVNPLKIGREQARAKLAADGIESEPTPLSPFGLRVHGKPSIQTHPLFREGAVEVQDEGSQLVCMLVGPTRHQMAVDFCAGAGGKTLLLGALMRSRGRLYAFDVNDARLRRLKPRVARAGLSNVQPVLLAGERDAHVKRLAGKIDRVLVDAPCTGSGTLRRNPDLKWRQTEAAVGELADRQARILAAAAALLKPGGRLVYATCSLLPEENDAVVDAFLAAHPDFDEQDACAELRQHGVALPGFGRLRLFPHAHGCDGFFACALVRKSPPLPPAGQERPPGQKAPAKREAPPKLRRTAGVNEPSGTEGPPGPRD